jgi:hypothetical protein
MKGEQRRPKPTRRYRWKDTQDGKPLDRFTGIPTNPRYLVLSDGLQRDGRRSAGSVDQPGYKGDLTQPD